MLISIIGAHGQIARHLTRGLVEADHTVRGLVRNPDHVGDLESDGAEPVVCDLESADDLEVEKALTGSEVVVFAAGSGPGSGAARKETMDRDGAIKAVGAAERVGAERFVMISSMGADEPPTDDEVFSVYLRAKAAADEAARAGGVEATIVRPGMLTDDPPTGSVELGEKTGRSEIPRADVAAVITEVITSGRGREATFELVSGSVPIAEAVATLD